MEEERCICVIAAILTKSQITYAMFGLVVHGSEHGLRRHVNVTDPAACSIPSSTKTIAPTSSCTAHLCNGAVRARKHRLMHVLVEIVIQAHLVL